MEHRQSKEGTLVVRTSYPCCSFVDANETGKKSGQPQPPNGFSFYCTLAGNGVAAVGTKLNNVAVVKYGTGFFADYRKFMDRGNVVDLAVAVVVGTSTVLWIFFFFFFLDERGLSRAQMDKNQ